VTARVPTSTSGEFPGHYTLTPRKVKKRPCSKTGGMGTIEVTQKGLRKRLVEKEERKIKGGEVARPYGNKLTHGCPMRTAPNGLIGIDRR